MMKILQFEINRAGIKEILKSDAVCEECIAKANEIASRANAMHDGFEVEPIIYPERNGAKVSPIDASAYFANLRNNILEKSKGF